MKNLIPCLTVILTLPLLAQRGGGGPGGGGGVGAGAGQNPPLASLKTVTPPAPTGMDRYVQDQAALVALGKAFFWDMQAGSDGRTACATCHFHAGADHRLQNSLSGPDALINQTLTSLDFPFRKLSNVANNRSAVISDKRQVAGSMGVVAMDFVDVQPGIDTDVSRMSSFASPFLPNGVHIRQVTGRNSPSVINAVFNVRNFWDGRASSTFTGATPFGASDSALRAVVFRNGQFEREAVRVENASLASQAVGRCSTPWKCRGPGALGRSLDASSSP